MIEEKEKAMFEVRAMLSDWGFGNLRAADPANDVLVGDTFKTFNLKLSALRDMARSTDAVCCPRDLLVAVDSTLESLSNDAGLVDEAAFTRVQSGLQDIKSKLEAAAAGDMSNADAGIEADAFDMGD